MMTAAKRPDPKRRPAASRPGRPGGPGRARPTRIPAVKRGVSRTFAPARSVTRVLTAASQRSAELRVGLSARRAVILAVVMCVLTLTVAGPVRTFFAQRAELKQQEQIETLLRRQIGELSAQKANLADPAHIRAQARERLGFVMPGETPYQVQLPPTVQVPDEKAIEPLTTASGDPWYTALWHTIADTPHGPPPAPVAPVAPPPGVAGG